MPTPGHRVMLVAEPRTSAVLAGTLPTELHHRKFLYIPSKASLSSLSFSVSSAVRRAGVSEVTQCLPLRGLQGDLDRGLGGCFDSPVDTKLPTDSTTDK